MSKRSEIVDELYFPQLILESFLFLYRFGELFKLNLVSEQHWSAGL